MANFAYLSVKKLRDDGNDSELLMNTNPHPSSDPLLYDPSLKHEYPKWIRFYNTSNKIWPLQIIKIMREDYDLIHSYVELPIFANLSFKKFVVTCQGSDLTRLAFAPTMKGFLLRCAYKKAKAIICPTVGCFPLLSKLKLDNGIFIPSIVDLQRFSPEKNQNPSNEKFTVFHPTSQLWNIKGNDKFLHGFKKFVKKFPKSKLIIVLHNADSKKTKLLIRDLHLEEFTEYIKGPLNVDDLKKYYANSDVVADQFLATDLGGIGREVLSMKKPLLTSCLVEKYEQVFGSVLPIASAFTPDEIAAKLELLTDSHFRKKLAQDGYSWIHKNFNPNLVSKKLQFVYEKILSTQKINEIRANLP